MRNTHYKPILILLFLIYVPGAYAQTGDPPPTLEPAIRFDHLPADDGLAQNSVQAILQDSRGFMWIGTQDGLNRFDGYTFTTYKHDPNNPNSMGGDILFFAFQDSTGTFWFGAPFSGLTKYDPATNTCIRHLTDPALPNHLPGGNVWNIE